MSLVCAISGQTPEEPVFSSSGYIFEKRLIVKTLETNGGVCPLSKEPLGVESLLPIKMNKAVKPRPPTCQSVPGMLTTLQNEWDALMLEQFELRRHVDMIRNQLAHTLYQHDAACRVIARLSRERDSARKELADMQTSLSTSGGIHQIAAQAAAQEVLSAEGSTGIPSHITEAVRAFEASARPARKARQVSSSLAAAESVAKLEASGSFPVHSNTIPGVTAVAVLKDEGSECFISGGVDGDLVLFDINTQSVRAKGSAHSKAVTVVAPISEGPLSGCFLSASKDKTARIWKRVAGENGMELQPLRTLRAHKSEVLAAAVHPTGLLAVTTGKDEQVVLWDLEKGCVLRTISDLGTSVTGIAFHPDGPLILGVGQSGELFIWDTLTGDLKLRAYAHTSGDTHIAMSENGTAFLSSGSDGLVKLWDLRKGASVAEIKLQGALGQVAFDYSGSFAVVAGESVHIISVGKKELSLIGEKTSHGDRVTSVAFCEDAKAIVSASMDRTVRLWM